jgi:hypothetical protein
VGQVILFRAAQDAAEHEDLRLRAGGRQDPTQRDGLARQGDKESLRAGGGQGRGDLGRAQSIGIGLDHGGAVGAPQFLFQPPVVRLDRVQIDREMGPGPRRGGTARASGLSHISREGACLVRSQRTG